ncbi:MAG: hypothetical protein JNK89_06210, partial [Saprospiraceae bacterium]|nr:hypothetical protein [Saprospiraceae bacterium]
MMNLRQVKSPRSGYSRFAAALLLPGLLLAAGLFARENGRLAAALPPATASVLADTTNIEATICTGLTYAFGDDELKVSGTYTQTFTATDGSDSTVVLDLTVLPAPVTELHAGICEGDSYPFFGLNLTTTGTYTQTLSTPEGCDSIVELSLRVVPFFDIQESATICAGDTVYFGGGALTGSGIYVDSLVATGGCDSVRTLVLTVLPSPQTHWHAGICEGTSLEFNGDTLDQSGTYTYIYPAENGCDSTVTLHLTVASYFETELEATICAGESYSFGGIDLTESGVYTDSLQAAGGCDSTLILTLTVLPPTPTTFAEATICDNQTITLGDQELSEPGTYTVALTGPNGCDSTVVLTLTVLPTSTTNLSVSICSNESYEIGGASLNESGAYTFVFPAE